MNIIEKNVTELREYENNPRHNDAAVNAVAESIRQFGFKVPIIIDSDGVIIAGHTRLRAAKQLGMEVVPCIVANDLTPEQIKAFRLADNKVGELASWDFEKLEAELAELTALELDMSKFGFLESEGVTDGYFSGAMGEYAREEKPKDYSIVYEIAFNNEEEQSEWYDFLGALRRKYPEVDTIAERILLATRWWIENEAE